MISICRLFFIVKFNVLIKELTIINSQDENVSYGAENFHSESQFHSGGRMSTDE